MSGMQALVARPICQFGVDGWGLGHIFFLRAFGIERDPSMPSIIQTERGVGYVFAVRSIVAFFDDGISWSPPANSSNFPLRASNKNPPSGNIAVWVSDRAAVIHAISRALWNQPI
jgi:hypothetical protein